MKREAVDRGPAVGRMSLEQKIGQCVVVGMSGTVITNDLREAITRYHASGIRLSGFTRMFKYFSDDKASARSWARLRPVAAEAEQRGPAPLRQPRAIRRHAQRAARPGRRARSPASPCT